jgi:hypothetical protein
MEFSRPEAERIAIQMGRLRLTAAFCSPTSISLDVMAGVYCVGWIDIHYPCEGHIKLQIRAAVPAEYLKEGSLRDFVNAIRPHLGIPAEATYEALFFEASRKIKITQPTDAEGRSDRME